MRRREILAGIGAAALIPKPSLATAIADEPALMPHLAIVEPHFHFRQYSDPADPRPRYLVPNFLADIRQSGHRIVSSIFVECSIMYRPDGPAELRSLGETAFVRSLADQPNARGAGIASGMLVRIDLTQGERVREIAEMHQEVSGGRLRGVRDAISWTDLPPFNTNPANRTKMESSAFRVGAVALARLGLPFDASVLHPQLAQLTELARAVPDLKIVVNHLGGPIGAGPDYRRMQDVFPDWRQAMRKLAEQPNVVMKLGGLGQFWENPPGANPGSMTLAASWRPWIETGIELFGIERCMFESNWPTNGPVGSLGNSYNAMKRIVAGYSLTDLRALFNLNASEIYKMT
jgi:L-fuconolactonase